MAQRVNDLRSLGKLGVLLSCGWITNGLLKLWAAWSAVFEWDGRNSERARRADQVMAMTMFGWLDVGHPTRCHMRYYARRKYQTSMLVPTRILISISWVKPRVKCPE